MKEYFSHDYNTRSDEKIKLLIRKFGMEGYGIYWSIVEDLYTNANALRLDYDGIAYDLHSDKETIKSIINDFDLFYIDGDLFGSNSVKRRLEERNEKSKKARKSAAFRWNKQQEDANALRTECECNAIKEKKSKEYNKETIPKGIVKKDKLSLSEQVDYKGLMDYFNKMFAGKLPAVSVMTEKRKRAVKARVTELGKDSIASVLKKVFESSFLLGLNDRNWRADFDWIFAPSHFIQILEGKYENGDSKNKRDSQQWKSDAIATISTTVNEQAKEKRAELKAKGVID
jgi:hypothetical protein